MFSTRGWPKALQGIYLFNIEPVFVNQLRSPGIDSQPGGPIRQPYLSYRPAGYKADRIDSSEPIPGPHKPLQNRAQAAKYKSDFSRFKQKWVKGVFCSALQTKTMFPFPRHNGYKHQKRTLKLSLSGSVYASANGCRAAVQRSMVVVGTHRVGTQRLGTHRPWGVWFLLKPIFWTYNVVEVSGHNLESSQTWCSCMDFLNHREGGMVFFQVFLLSRLQCTVTDHRNCKRGGCSSLKK
jgi:hypothetical protein